MARNIIDDLRIMTRNIIDDYRLRNVVKCQVLCHWLTTYFTNRTSFYEFKVTDFEDI